ncbi:MAG: DEAD/DEAH box helicase [Planctomycetes bacterium]|nr:DEAD/DEAH box helicase [Planctomycetota bacterium]
MNDYQSFLESKRQLGADAGFDPLFLPDFLFDFQRSLVEWAVRKGRAAIFADCGLGKTPMQLVWAQNVHKHTGKRVLILTPLAVGQQTVREAHKFGIDAEQSRDGKLDAPIVVTNYEKLHLFKPEDFGGVVCDESSILKNYSGQTRKQVTRFMAKLYYRLLCTATAAPNDYVELGTSSEALGELSHTEMLKRFFKYLDDKGQKQEARQQAEAEKMQEAGASYFQKLAYRVAQTIGQWRLKHHAVQHFWRWVASWARACRKPSDLGFDDGAFNLPPLIERDHVVKAKRPAKGMLFDMPAFGLGAEREERKRTITERCELAAELVASERSAVVWCQANAEGDMLEKMIPGAAQIAGKTPDERKIELYETFAAGELRVLVIKPKIGAWGLNWQHCNRVVTFASHSYEQYYQSVRRCWRFGQKRPVTVDVIATEGEIRVLANMRKKAAKADAMFAMLVQEMNSAMCVARPDNYTKKAEVPPWLLPINV